MKEIIINNKSYYEFNDLLTNYEDFFKSYSTRCRKIITQRKLRPVDDYGFINNKSGNSFVPNILNPSTKDRLVISKKWINDNVINPETSRSMTIPAIFHLDESELFCYNDFYYEIETRGERSIDKCYFLGSHIASVLGLLRNESFGAREVSDYIEHEEYEIFNIRHKNGIYYKTYYLTYYGVMRYIFRSRSSISRKLSRWISETMFTIQFGSTCQKQNLIENIMGIDLSSFKQVMSGHCGSISCVYLIYIGTVKQLKNSLHIDGKADTDIVCKYGRTNDIDRRINELNNKYKKLNPDVTLSVITFSFIDETCNVKVESELSNLFNETKLVHEVEKELIITNKTNIPIIKKLYQTLEIDYGREISCVRKTYEDEIKRKDIEIRNLEKQVFELTIENLQLKNLDLQLKNNTLRNSIL